MHIRGLACDKLTHLCPEQLSPSQYLHNALASKQPASHAARLAAATQGAYARFDLSVCYANNPDPSLCARDFRAFTAAASPLLVVVTGGNTVAGEGPIVISAAQSTDPDDEPGNIAFSWACARAPAAGGDAGGGGGCTDVNGAAMALPPVADLSVQLLGSPSGIAYELTATATKGTRAANLTVSLLVRSAVRVPVIALQALSAAKVSPTEKLVLRSSVVSQTPATLRTLWSVVAPASLAGTFLAAPGVAGVPLSSQSLVINAGSLPARQTVTFRITATDSGGSSSADIAVPVSGTPYGRAGPGSLGTITISPSSGNGLKTTFTLAAGGWVRSFLSSCRLCNSSWFFCRSASMPLRSRRHSAPPYGSASSASPPPP